MPFNGKITSEFAILDVKKGRQALDKNFADHKRTGVAEAVPVTITGFIVGVWSGDDGTSREFEVRVTDVKVEDAA